MEEVVLNRQLVRKCVYNFLLTTAPVSLKVTVEFRPAITKNVLSLCSWISYPDRLR
jgi:hypothetical protein